MCMDFGDALREHAAYSAEILCSTDASQDFRSKPIYFEEYLANLNPVRAVEKNGGQGRNGTLASPARTTRVCRRWIPRFARHPFGAPAASKLSRPVCRASVELPPRRFQVH
jgi:hypothetical protein